MSRIVYMVLGAAMLMACEGDPAATDTTTLETTAPDVSAPDTEPTPDTDEPTPDVNVEPEVAAGTPRAALEEMCKKLLANPVMENFKIE